MGDKYLALLGDIVGSRKLDNRRVVQQKLEDILARVNSGYSASIKTKLIINAGDEFQGLLLPTSEAYKMAVTIMEHMHPVQIRFGLGYGEITTSLKETSIGMDGPAFYAARHALESRKSLNQAAIQLCGSDLPQSQLRAVNALLSSLSVIRQFWPDNFQRALPLIRQNLTQTEVAKAIGVSQSAVSSMLKRARWQQIKAIEKELAYLLRLMFKETQI